MKSKALLTSAILVSLGAAGLTQTPPTRTVRLQFAKGLSYKSIVGTIKGYETVDYLVRAGAGKTMNIRLKTNQPSNYFTINAPGSQYRALYDSSMGSNSYTGKLPSSGIYVIRSYIYRNDARRGAVANYTLSVAIK